MSDDEIWKNVPDMNNRYEASNMGQIRLAANKKILKLQKNNAGYLRISLMKKSYLVHRLIAITFIPNPENKKTIHHKNMIRDDNNVTNIEWSTHLEQAQQKKERMQKNKNCPIWQCDSKTKKHIKLFQSVAEASLSVMGKTTGSSKISLVANRRPCKERNDRIPKSAYGYYWEFNKVENLVDEIWINIDNLLDGKYPGYELSNFGRIKDPLKKIRSPYQGCHGYATISIGVNKCLAHVLVAKVFVENLSNKKYVNHKDGNKMNTNQHNLEWVNHSENMQHAIDNHLSKICIPVYQYNLKSEKLIAEFSSIKLASDFTGIPYSSISNNLNNRSKHAGGYLWKKI